jgi:hypothetical protein
MLDPENVNRSTSKKEVEISFADCGDRTVTLA